MDIFPDAHHICLQSLDVQVAAGGYVEPLSTVSAGILVDGRVSGVPAQVDYHFFSNMTI